MGPVLLGMGTWEVGVLNFPSTLPPEEAEALH